MTQTVTLTFNGVTAEVNPKKDGMYDLNDIWRVFRLPEKKRPSKWNNSEKQHLINYRNLVSLNLGRDGMTLATKEALYAYAMWCDFEFYMVVVQTFSLVVEGKLEEAADKASEVVVLREWSNLNLRTANFRVVLHS